MTKLESQIDLARTKIYGLEHANIYVSFTFLNGVYQDRLASLTSAILAEPADPLRAQNCNGAYLTARAPAFSELPQLRLALDALEALPHFEDTMGAFTAAIAELRALEAEQLELEHSLSQAVADANQLERELVAAAAAEAAIDPRIAALRAVAEAARLKMIEPPPQDPDEVERQRKIAAALAPIRRREKLAVEALADD